MHKGLQSIYWIMLYPFFQSLVIDISHARIDLYKVKPVKGILSVEIALATCSNDLVVCGIHIPAPLILAVFE